MLDEVPDHRLKAGQVALQQGLDNFVVKIPYSVKPRKEKLSGWLSFRNRRYAAGGEELPALQDGPNDVDQLVHAGDKGDFLLLPTGQQTLVEGLYGRIAAGGDDYGKVEGLAQLLNAGTADLRPAPNGAARLPFSRSDADVGHDLGGLVELGKISEMSQPACGGGGADARDGRKQFLVLLEPFMPVHVNRDLSVDLPDLLVEMSKLLLHGLDDEIQGISVLFEGLEAVLRGGSRLHELLPPGHELMQLSYLGPFGFPRAEGIVPGELQSVPGDDKSILSVRLRPGKATLSKGLH